MLSNPITALRHVPFRWFMVAQLCSSHANWMDNLVRGWLVYEITGSVAQLGLVTATKGIPLLGVSIVGGVLADRLDRRRLLQGSCVVAGVTHAATAGLILTGGLELWHLYVTAAVVGVARSVQSPTRLAIVNNTVDQATLQNAVVLNTSAGTLAQSIGPALGGVLVDTSGFGWAFGVQATLLGLAVVATNRIELSRELPGKGGGESFLVAVRGGFRYVRHNRLVLMLLMVALLPMLFGLPYQNLIPAAADELFGLGPTGTGLLLGGSGVGAFMSLVVLAFLPTARRPGLWMLLSVMMFGGSIALFAWSGHFGVALLAVVLAGVSRGVYRTFNHTLLLSVTDDNYLGRVNSIYTMDRGLVPLGTVMVGFAAEAFGTGLAIGLSGSVCVVVGAAVAFFARSLRNA